MSKQKKVTGSVIGGKRLHASKKEERNIKKKYPKLIIDTNTHYLLHKVNKAYINDRGYLSFEYEDGSGEIKLQGPFYWPNSAKPADEVLKKHGLEKPEDIKYLIAYHCGAFPNGSPAWLLKSEENIPDDFYEKVSSVHSHD